MKTKLHEFMFVTGVKISVYRVTKFPIWAGAFFPKTPEKALTTIILLLKLLYT
jgi:hypothetical protein